MAKKKKVQPNCGEMAAILPSRFAVLKVEGEDPEDSKTTKKPQPAKSGSAGDRNSVTTKPKPKKKKKPAENQANAKQAAPQAGKPQERGDDWESWKRRDDQFVSDVYEQDLQQALLLSRLDYEEKKEFYEAHQKETTVANLAAPGSRGNVNKNKKKSTAAKKEKKTTTMTLEEFNQLGGNSSCSEMVEPENREAPDIRNNEKRSLSPPKEAIFEQVARDAKNILSREQRMEELKTKQPFLAEQARTLQFQDELEKKDQQITALKKHIEALAAELKVVKLRNKQLCNILAQGEMQDKAEILRDFEEVTQVKDELTQQVTELHAALEQERSKVRLLQQDLKKGGKREPR
ncbi:G kinase-anchoring protein 1-like isoform X2 [Dermacentor andersoni]|nr:G kinase-anchoring protein 1-like isoform X2 [Dermacentor andersoni]